MDRPERAQRLPASPGMQEICDEVDRIREVLESVVKDLNEVSESLSRAESEKQVLEQEIEQLKASLRRINR